MVENSDLVTQQASVKVGEIRTFVPHSVWFISYRYIGGIAILSPVGLITK